MSNHDKADQDPQKANPWVDRISEAYYGQMGDDFGRRTRDRINWMCSQCLGNDVLDIGCSQGVASILLAREGFRVIGLDIEPEVIAYAERDRAKERPEVAARVDFVCQDLAAYESTGHDNVIMGEVLEHQTSPTRFLQTAITHLNPGGRLIVTVPYGLHPWPDHKCTVFPRQLLEPLRGHCRLLHLDIADGYVRAVTQRNEQFDSAAAIEYDAIVEVTEAGALEIQRRLYELASRHAIAEQSLGAKSHALEQQQKQAREYSSKLQQDLDSVTRQSEGLRQQLLQTKVDLDRRTDENRLLQEKLEVSHGERKTAKAFEERMQALRAELHEAQEKRAGHYAKLQMQVQKSADMEQELASLRHENHLYKYSVALALGQALLASRTPRGLIKLPKAVLAAVRLRHVRAELGSSQTGAAFSAPKAEMCEALASDVCDNSAKTALEVLGWQQRVEPGQVRMLSIFDEFSRECFRPHAALIEPRPDNWRELLDTYAPQLAFVESSWRGNGGSWQYRVAKYQAPPGRELEALVSECKSRGIPAVFWNKEDPVHFDNFIDSASQFDFIFTTAEDAIPRYRDRTSAKISVLPFAAEISLHNPLGSHARNGRICFAGSYYANRFQERRDDQLMLLDAARGFDFDIYDRNHGAQASGPDDFRFPERFRPHVRGRLPYEQMGRAYRSYSVFLNVNSVIDSPTMFSRRVYELLACGTPVVSTWARGIEEVFGQDLVWMVRSADEAKSALSTLLNDAGEWRRRSLQGIRAVMRAHTFGHRFEQMLGGIGLQGLLSSSSPEVLVVGEAASQQQVYNLADNFRRQKLQHGRSTLLIVARSGGLEPPSIDCRFVQQKDTPLAILGAEVAGEILATHVAAISPAAAYGRNYLEDLVHACSYSKAEMVGKPMMPASEYQYGAELDSAGKMLDVVAIRAAGLNLADVMREDGSSVLVAAGARRFAADTANFQVLGETATTDQLGKAWGQIEI